MRNPLLTKLPLKTDIHIRLRLLKAWAIKHKTLGAFSLGTLLIPAVATWLFVVQGVQPSTRDTDLLISEIRVTQQEEIAKAEQNIYHVVRTISEGADKSAYVREVLGESAPAQKRIDRVETFQHSDTALALIESNGREMPFEIFLSREAKDGGLTLQHYAPTYQEVPEERLAYDTAHDLASLYSAYTSLERPTIPLLPDTAVFVELDVKRNQAVFRTVLNETITILSYVDVETKLVVEDVIYVAGRDDTYEMTRVAYTEREVIPPSEFDTIFDPTKYDYELIEQKLNT